MTHISHAPFHLLPTLHPPTPRRQVLYTADCWLEKNRGALHEDLRVLLGASEDAMMQKVYLPTY